jgi:hypothetical protein
MCVPQGVGERGKNGEEPRLTEEARGKEAAREEERKKKVYDG